LERPTRLSFRHEEIAPAATIPGPIVDLKSISAATSAECLILTNDGELIRIDPSQGSVRALMNVRELSPTLAPKLSLHVSPRAELAVVVEAQGQHGLILDLRTRRATMTLDRGDFHPELTDFPVAFFETGGQLRLVHQTSWNRLDISDPRTGTSLTERSPTLYQRGEQRPEHDLDYVHGSLSISPGGDRIVDNGWRWHPVGIVETWSLRRWVEQNAWESEDGPSKRSLCWRNYFWGGPLCWIDDRTVAVWGYGNNDENLIPAALIFNAESGERVRWFAGPVGAFVFDRYLFSSSPKSGTSVWDVETGEGVLQDASLDPSLAQARRPASPRHPKDRPCQVFGSHVLSERVNPRAMP
jgi:hypothetical protein